jgi:hypothetical protein
VASWELTRKTMQMKTLNLGNSLRNVHGISLSTGAGFLFVFKAWQQVHSRLHNYCHNTEDGQKDKLVVDVILCTFLNTSGNRKKDSFTGYGTYAIE